MRGLKRWVCVCSMAGAEGSTGYVKKYHTTACKSLPEDEHLVVLITVCPTCYRTRHFVKNFTTNEDISKNSDTQYRHIPLHFSHNESTPVQISLQYLHWC